MEQKKIPTTELSQKKINQIQNLPKTKKNLTKISCIKKNQSDTKK